MICCDRGGSALCGAATAEGGLAAGSAGSARPSPSRAAAAFNATNFGYAQLKKGNQNLRPGGGGRASLPDRRVRAWMGRASQEADRLQVRLTVIVTLSLRSLTTLMIGDWNHETR